MRQAQLESFSSSVFEQRLFNFSNTAQGSASPIGLHASMFHRLIPIRAPGLDPYFHSKRRAK
jgi:hypothetical protein